MKKIILGMLLSASLVTSFASTTNAVASDPVTKQPRGMQAPQMNPECKPLMENFRKDQPQLEAAIKANNANEVGKIVIKNHNFAESFIKTHPSCKMGMMKGMKMNSSTPK